MMSLLFSILSFLCLLTVLIGIHELGHFLCARCFNMRVTHFSIGFGKALWSCRDKKGTQYRLGCIPFGGYVRMFEHCDKMSAEEDGLTFAEHAVWKRMLVVLAGPLFSLLLAGLLFWLVFMIGLPSLRPVIGHVTKGSIAAQAGLKPRQEIIKVNGQATPTWRWVQWVVLAHRKHKKKITLTVKPMYTDVLIEYALVVNTARRDLSGLHLLRHIGIKPYVPSMLPIIKRVVQHSPAERAGLHAGDLILQVAHHDTKDWKDVSRYVKRHPGKTFSMRVKRQENILDLTVTSQLRQGVGDKTYGFIGVHFKDLVWPKSMLRFRQLNPLRAFVAAGYEVCALTRLSVHLFAKLFLGELSLNNVSGPIEMAYGAARTARLGLTHYLSFAALLSISLGVLNMLPIPILDGGRFVYYLIEWIRRRPLSEKTQNITTQIGLLLMIMLIGVAVVNDVMRFMQR